ncbi:MAG: hypothetical protein ABI537_03580 [Casimicrobiaceae bacterium]
MLNKADICRLRLDLQGIGIMLGQQPVLDHRSREAADIARGGCCGGGCHSHKAMKKRLIPES